MRGVHHVEECGGCIFEQVEHELESGRPFVIWIRHGVICRVSDCEICHAHKFCGTFFSVGQTFEVIHVHVVHADHDVEIVKVEAANLAGAMVKFIAALPRGFAHTPVGQVACMSAVETVSSCILS